MSNVETTIVESRVAAQESCIRRLYELSDAWDVDALSAVLAPDVSFRLANGDPGVGLQAYQALSRATQAVVASVRHTILRVIPGSSDHATVELAMHYVHRSGRTLEIPCAVVFHFNGADLIDGYRIYLDVGDFFASAA